MINRILTKLFGALTNIVDYQKNQKILKFFKNKLKNDYLKVKDIGAHKGETINFLNNFKIDDLSFEPNLDYIIN